MNSLLPLLVIVAMIALFYLFVLRPAKRQQTAAKQIVDRVAAGDEIMTTAGIYGTVISVEDDIITLEVAPGVQLRYAKAAVAKIKDDPAAGEGSDAAAESTDSAEEVATDHGNASATGSDAAASAPSETVTGDVQAERR